MAHTPGPWEVELLKDQEVRRREKIVRAAAPTMLDVLKLIDEECVCAGGRCAVCGNPAEYHPSSAKHDYVSPAPCLGCQVDAAIKLAEG